MAHKLVHLEQRFALDEQWRFGIVVEEMDQSVENDVGLGHAVGGV